MKFKSYTNILLMGIACFACSKISIAFGENAQQNFELLMKNVVWCVLDIKCWIILVYLDRKDF